MPSRFVMACLSRIGLFFMVELEEEGTWNNWSVLSLSITNPTLGFDGRGDWEWSWQESIEAFVLLEETETIFRLLQGATEVSVIAVALDGLAQIRFDVRALMETEAQGLMEECAQQ